MSRGLHSFGASRLTCLCASSLMRMSAARSRPTGNPHFRQLRPEMGHPTNGAPDFFLTPPLVPPLDSLTPHDVPADSWPPVRRLPA